jgi:hypothetical protein
VLGGSHTVADGRRPRPLQLTSGDEIVAMENLDVLKLNGFEVAVDDEAAMGVGEKISLTAMPISKETVFDFKGASGGCGCPHVRRGLEWESVALKRRS